MSLQSIKRHLGDQHLTFFDIGAKGGVTDLKALASLTNVLAFEPNPSEYNFLVVQKNPYRECRFYNEALSDRMGNMDFHISRKSSYSSLLPFDQQVIKTHLGRMPQYDQWMKDFSADQVIKVKVNTINNFCAYENITHIDFLKLDTQGSELMILNGSTQMLPETLIIKCEVSFIPVYKQQPAFSEIDLFLKAHQFCLVDCVFYPEAHSRKTRLAKNKVADQIRYSSGGDAIYMKNPVLAGPSAQFKMGIILACLGYISEAALIFETLSIPESEAESILGYLSQKTFREKLKLLAKNWVPPKIIQLIKSLR